MRIKEHEISELGLFRGCSRNDLAWISRTGDILDVPPDSTLALEGRRVREFFIVVRGRAKGTNGAGSVLLGPGAYVGERGLLNGETHPMTITSLLHSRLLVFESRAFRGMLERVPSVGRALMRDLAGALRVADQEVRSLRAVS